MATPVILPKQGNSVESCIIESWLKQVGEVVRAGEPICEVQTDKATVEIESPADGTLLAIFAAVDADVPVLQNIAAIGAPGEDVSDLAPVETGGAAPAVAAEAAAPVAATAVTTAAATASTAGSSPRARALAVQQGVDVATLAGSGPGGLVIERDVAQAAPAHLSAAARAALAQGGLVAPARGSGAGGLVTAADLTAAQAAAPVSAAPVAANATIPVKGVRKITAQRMRASLADSAQLTLQASADATVLLGLRARLKAQGGAAAAISVNDLILYAVARTLPRFPALNAHWLGDRIEQFATVELGVAVDTDKGLMVPVLRGAQALSPAQISATFKPMALACQAGQADPAWLSGGTFTVTNLGALGIEHFTPVLNTPEVAILGVGAPVLRPLRGEDGQIAFVEHLALSLTIDHQAVDGAPAARFLQALCQTLATLDAHLAAA